MEPRASPGLMLRSSGPTLAGTTVLTVSVTIIATSTVKYFEILAQLDFILCSHRLTRSDPSLHFTAPCQIYIESSLNRGRSAGSATLRPHIIVGILITVWHATTSCLRRESGTFKRLAKFLCLSAPGSMETPMLSAQSTAGSP